MKSPLLSAGKYEIDNYYNALYLLYLFAGSQNQQLEVAFDTGSDWLVVASEECSCTFAPMFDETESFTYVRINDQLQAQYYGDGEIYGYYGTDDVYLDRDRTVGVLEFPMLLANYANNLNSESGVFGFSRNFEIYGIDPGPLYYHYLYD